MPKLNILLGAFTPPTLRLTPHTTPRCPYSFLWRMGGWRGGGGVLVAIMPLTVPLTLPHSHHPNQPSPCIFFFFCRSLFSPPQHPHSPPPRLPRGAGDSPSAVKGRGSHDGFHRWSVEIAGKGLGSVAQQRESQGEKYGWREGFVGEKGGGGRQREGGRGSGVGEEFEEGAKKKRKKKRASFCGFRNDFSFFVGLLDVRAVCVGVSR